MKKLLNAISFVFIFQFFAQFVTAQFTCLFSDTAQFNLPDDSQELYASKNGWHLPANGTVRVLFVFVEIDYDTGIDPNPNGTNEWPVNALPVWANNFLDPQIPTGQSNGLLTQYYREASLGNYNLIGDYLIAPDNGGVFMILKSYANSVGHENAAINKINQLLNGNVVTANGLNDISFFDNWTTTVAGKPKITPSIDLPHKWDHIMFIWRNRLDSQGNPYNGTGNASPSSIGTPLLGYQSDSYSNFGTFKSIPLAIARHEYAHLLYGHNNFHSAGGGWGAPSSYPYDYWIPLTGGWSILGLSGSSLQTWNAWDRQRMDWKASGNSYNPSARNEGNSEETNGDLDATNENDAGIYTLRDFVTFGDAIRIKLPFIDPENEFPEFLWIENHTGIEHNGSVFDKWQYEDATCVESFVAGMMAYIQIDKDTRESSNNNAVYGGYANYTRPLSANGRFDRSFESTSSFNECVQWGETWAFIEGLSNPLTGGCDQEHYTVDVDNNNIIGQSDQRMNFTKKINDTYYKHLYELGATNHVFTFNGNKKIGISTNPSSASSMNLVSQAYPPPNGLKNHKKIYLNGISIEIVACDINKNLQIQIRFDDVDIDRDVRWCADEIVLNPIATESGYSLNVKEWKTITIDQTLTPTRMDNPIVINGENIFASPTTFVVKPYANVNLEPNAKILLENNSTLHLNTASYCAVGNNGNIEVKSGTTFYIDDCGILEIFGNGKLIVRNGAILCISPNTVLAFENGLQNLILESEVIIPEGYINPTALINNTIINPSINTNTIWTFEDYYINGSLTVEPQTTLTIQTSTINFVDKNSKIIIKPGAKLVLDESTLTSACGGFWQGIEVWGNTNASQYALPGQPCPQGKLVLQNGATIENALNAVALWKPGDYSKSGGIIVATDAVFKNNRRAVEFISYQNFNPFDSAELLGNLSHFTNCSFITDQDYMIPSPFYAHITMWEVDGIAFKGNTFQNSLAQTPGRGIYSIDARYSLLPLCNSQTAPCPLQNIVPNSFSGFDAAIEAINAGSSRAIFADTVRFINNGYGVKLSGSSYASVTRSVFEIGKLSTQACESNFGIGIELSDCNGYMVENNHFSLAAGNSGEGSIGIRVYYDEFNTAYLNEIYRNTFNGVNRGNLAEGKNRLDGSPRSGLVYQCNQNTDNFRDFHITDLGIAGHQGSLSLPAGNTFSNISGTLLPPRHIANYSANHITYFYSSARDQEPFYITNTTKQSTVAFNSCPSHLGGGSGEIELMGLSAEQQSYFEEQLDASRSAYNSLSTLYNSLVDGGSTSGMIAAVDMAWPGDMWELRAELLGGSPHLSKEVLKKAADRTDVLPESIIFEVLSTNPDELKDAELMEYLQTKAEPLPDYMIEVLESLRENITYKTILQNQMAYQSQQQARAERALLHNLIHNQSSGLQGLRDQLAAAQSLPTDMQLVDVFLQEGKTSQALGLAAMLPQLYALTGEELAEHNRYMSLKQLQANLLDADRTIFELDAAEKATLLDLIGQSNGLAGTQARNIMAFIGEYAYCDCPAPLDKALKMKQLSNTNIQTLLSPSVEVRPIPANNWVSFAYTLEGEQPQAVLELRDATGKTVHQVQLSQPKGEYVWDTRALQAGTYYYNLKTANTNKTGKVVIVK